MSIEKLIEKTFDDIAKFGDGQLEFNTADIERLTFCAKQYVELTDNISNHLDEENSDTCTVGELVLTELNMWR